MPIAAPKTVKHKVPIVISNNLTILLFGHTGAGKTALGGELAEHYFKNHRKRTRLYTADRGGYDTIRPYVSLGVIQPVPLFGDPWVWLNHAVQGHTIENGAWNEQPDNSDIGLFMFEGMTSISMALMSWMADASTKGVNIGGGGSFSFKAGNAEEGEIKIGSNNMAHYSQAQQQVYNISTRSQHLPGTVLWTAGDARGEDDSIGAILGPQIAGRRLTGEAPMWFKYTFRVATEVEYGGEPKHVLYLMDHIEMNAKMAKGIANARIPLAGGDSVQIPSKLCPASLVGALEIIERRQDAATDEIRARLGL